MTYRQELSGRAAKDLDRLDRKTQQRILSRVAELANDPYDVRVSAELADTGGLRRSRVGGWRIIFTVNNETHMLCVVTIERRGQVYKRLAK